MTNTTHSQCRESRFNPWSGNWIPHTATKQRSFVLQLRPDAAEYINAEKQNKTIALSYTSDGSLARHDFVMACSSSYLENTELVNIK